MAPVVAGVHRATIDERMGRTGVPRSAGRGRGPAAQRCALAALAARRSRFPGLLRVRGGALDPAAGRGPRRRARWTGRRRPRRRPLPPPASRPLPVPDVGTPDALDFIDCTDDVRAVLPVPVPADRRLRYECADLPVIDDTSNGRRRQSSISLTRVTPGRRAAAAAAAGARGQRRRDRHPAGRPARRGGAARRCCARFSLVGMDRAGPGHEPAGLRAAGAALGDPGRRRGRGRPAGGGRAAGGRAAGGPGVLPHRGRHDHQLRHRAHRQGHRAGPDPARGAHAERARPG